MKTITRYMSALLTSWLVLVVVAQAGYAEDRALIEDLQARYMFAFDFGDPEGYANTFAEDGVINFGSGDIVGREAIAEFIREGREDRLEARASTEQGAPSVGRHIISNIVVEVDGDQARSVAYWSHMSSDDTGYGTVDFFGHYEDELVKIDGDWYFSRRHVYNEAIEEWAADYVNPVTTPSAPPRERAPTE